MNEENESERRMDGAKTLNQEVPGIKKEDVKAALKVVSPDDILVEVW